MIKQFLDRHINNSIQVFQGPVTGYRAQLQYRYGFSAIYGEGDTPEQAIAAAIEAYENVSPTIAKPPPARKTPALETTTKDAERP